MTNFAFFKKKALQLLICHSQPPCILLLFLLLPAPPWSATPLGACQLLDLKSRLLSHACQTWSHPAPTPSALSARTPTHTHTHMDTRPDIRQGEFVTLLVIVKLLQLIDLSWLTVNFAIFFYSFYILNKLVMFEESLLLVLTWCKACLVGHSPLLLLESLLPPPPWSSSEGEKEWRRRGGGEIQQELYWFFGVSHDLISPRFPTNIASVNLVMGCSRISFFSLF